MIRTLAQVPFEFWPDPQSLKLWNLHSPDRASSERLSAHLSKLHSAREVNWLSCYRLHGNGDNAMPQGYTKSLQL